MLYKVTLKSDIISIDHYLLSSDYRNVISRVSDRSVHYQDYELSIVKVGSNPINIDDLPDNTTTEGA